MELKTLYGWWERGQLPHVWVVYGPEDLRIREAIKRLSETFQPQETQRLFAGSGGTHSGEDLEWGDLESAWQTRGLFAQRRLLIVYDFLRQHSDGWEKILGSVRNTDLTQVPETLLILWEQDLDARRKGMKALIEGGVIPQHPHAVVTFHAESVAEQERPRWIAHLMERRGLRAWMETAPEVVPQLSALPDWSLSMVDRELEKWQLLVEDTSLAPEALRALLREARELSFEAHQETLIRALFDRRVPELLEQCGRLAQTPEAAFPMIGLIHWHARMLLGMHLATASGGGAMGVPSYFAEKARRWGPQWNLAQLTRLESHLCELDVRLKSTFHAPLGLWTDFVLRGVREAG